MTTEPTKYKLDDINKIYINKTFSGSDHPDKQSFFVGCTFINCTFEDTSKICFSDCNLSGCTIDRPVIEFERCFITNSVFCFLVNNPKNKPDLRNSLFENCTLVNIDFCRMFLSKVSFRQSVLIHIDFSNTVLTNCNFSKATLNHQRLLDTAMSIKNCKFSNVNPLDYI
jgi:uncharacterized protein YjbI with pentapeptide repeats